MKKCRLLVKSYAELVGKVSWNPHLILRGLGKVATVLQCKESGRVLMLPPLTYAWHSIQLLRRQKETELLTATLDYNICPTSEFTNLKNQFYKKGSTM